MLVPFTDRRVLLTGAGGSIGSALAREIARQKPRSLILLDHSEGNLYQLGLLLAGSAELISYSLQLGDVCDGSLLAELFEQERPQIVLHAAAFKHVPLMESHTIAAVRNNALRTNLLAKMASSHEAEAVVMVSTDKAVEPYSVMGATKRVAEMAMLRWRNARTDMRVLRLGNVLGSAGSVVPAFLQQIAEGGPVRVTDAEASRFFFSMEEAVDLLVSIASLTSESGIYVPEPREPVKILDLARQLMRERSPGREIGIKMTGLRPGDKLTEAFVSQHETVSDSPDPRLQRVHGPGLPHEDFDAAMHSLEQRVEERDVAGVLEMLCRLVPGYRPSQTALAAGPKQESNSR